MTNETKQLTHKEIRERLTKRANRSLSQKIRWITKRWVQEKLTAREMFEQEEKLFNNLERQIKGLKE